MRNIIICIMHHPKGINFNLKNDRLRFFKHITMIIGSDNCLKSDNIIALTSL